MNRIANVSLEKIFTIDKDLYAKNPHFGMDIFADDFLPSGCVVLENNAKAGQGIPVRCEYYRLALSIKGEYIRHVNQFDYTISAHTLQLIHPSDIHSFEYSDNSLEYILLFERGFLPENLGALLAFHQQSRQPVKLDSAKYEQALNLFEAVNKEYQTRAIHYQDVVKSLLTQLLYLLKREQVRLPQKAPRSRAEQITDDFLSLVEAHFHDTRSVQRYATLLGISPKHLSETIKHTLGKPALFFIHRRVLKESQYLLRYSNHSIKHIAALLHFSDSAEFGRFFRKHKTISPKNYRMKR